MRLAALLLVVLVACARSDDGPGYTVDGSFVAEDAGQIPLTSPGTPVRTERPVVEVPFPPLEEIPAPVPEEPLDYDADTVSAPPRPTSPPRQPRATDTVAIDTAGQRTVPLVRPPAPPPVPPAGTVPAPAPAPRPTPPPAPADTGGADDGGGGGDSGDPRS